MDFRRFLRVTASPCDTYATCGTRLASAPVAPIVVLCGQGCAPVDPAVKCSSRPGGYSLQECARLQFAGSVRSEQSAGECRVRRQHYPLVRHESAGGPRRRFLHQSRTRAIRQLDPVDLCGHAKSEWSIAASAAASPAGSVARIADDARQVGAHPAAAALVPHPPPAQVEKRRNGRSSGKHDNSEANNLLHLLDESPNSCPRYLGCITDFLQAASDPCA